MTDDNDHNRFMDQFIRSLKPVLLGDEPMKNTMVIYESITFGIMMLLKNAFDMTPEGAAHMVEAALGQAIERFAAENNKEKKR